MTTEQKVLLREKKNDLTDTYGMMLYSMIIALDIFFVFVVFDLPTLFSIVLFSVNILVADIGVTLFLDIFVVWQYKVLENEEDFIVRLQGIFLSMAVYVSQCIAYSVLNDDMLADTGLTVVAYLLIFLVTCIPFMFLILVVRVAREVANICKKKRSGEGENATPTLHENTLKSDIVDLQKRTELLKSIHHGLSEQEMGVLEMKQYELIGALELLQGVILASTDEVLAEAKALIQEMNEQITTIIVQQDEKIIAKVGRKIARIKGDVYVK